MAAGAGAVVVVVNGDISGLEKALGKALRSSETTGKKMSKSMENVNKAVTRLTRVVGALASVWAVREVIRVADAYTLLDSKLRLVSDSAVEAESTWQKLFEVAQETRSSFRDTANTFVNLQLNVKDVGVTVDQTLEFLELWNKALIINGSTQREAASATLQVKQAMSSGRLAGEEYRGVSEGNAYWMTELARATGMTVGEVRELSMAQKLTRDFILEATPKMAASINRNFANVTKTIGQSFTQLINVLEAVFAEANRAGGATVGLAKGISAIAEVISKNKNVFTEFFVDQIGEFVKTMGDFESPTEDLVRTIEFLAALAEEANKLKKIREDVGIPDWARVGFVGAFLYGGEAALAWLKEGADIIHDTVVALKEASDLKGLSDEMMAVSHAAYEMSQNLEQASHYKLADIEMGPHLEDLKDYNEAVEHRILLEEVAAKNQAMFAKFDKGAPDDSWVARYNDNAKEVSKTQDILADREKELTETLEAQQKARNEVSAALLEQDAFLKLEATQVEVTAQHYDDLKESLISSAAARDKAAEDSIKNQVEAIRQAAKEWEEEQDKSLKAVTVLYEQFVQNVGSEFEDLFKGVLKGELNTFEDVFESFGDALLDIWIDLMAKMAAKWFLNELLGLGSAAGFSLSGLFGGLGGGGGGGGAVTGAAGAGIGGWIASKFGGAGAAAAAPAMPSVAANLGVAYGAPIGGAIPVAITSVSPTSGLTAGTQLALAEGSYGPAAAGGFGGLGLGLAAYGAFAGPQLMKTLSGYDPQLEDFLNEKLVSPFQIAAEGVSDSFQSVSDTMAGSLVPELAQFDSISVDAANGVMVLGQNIRGAAGEADGLNSIMGVNIQLYDQASGSWQNAGVSMRDLVAEVDAMGPSSAEAVTQMSELVAAQHGLASISDELESSYYALGAATRELAGTSMQAARELNRAGGSISSIRWGSIPSDQHADVRRELASYAHGTDFVPATGPAYLHKGEAVLTEQENQMRGDAMVALAVNTKKTADILKRIEKTGLPTSSRTGVYG